MSETLVIRLRAAEEAPASWLIVDANGARSGPVNSGPVADALGAAHASGLVHRESTPGQEPSRSVVIRAGGDGPPTIEVDGPSS